MEFLISQGNEFYSLGRSTERALAPVLVFVLGPYRLFCCRVVEFVMMLTVGRERMCSGRFFVLYLKSVTTEVKVTRSFILSHFNSLKSGVT